LSLTQDLQGLLLLAPGGIDLPVIHGGRWADG
jgi:hypothetical protein